MYLYYVSNRHGTITGFKVYETLEFSEEHKPNKRSTVCNDETVRRLSNLHIAIICYGFTVTLVTLTAPWYCGRNVGYSHLILLQE